jgi:acyl carrier protein
MEEAAAERVLEGEQVISSEQAIAAVERVLRRKGRTVALEPGMSLRELELDSLDVGELFVTLEELSGRELDAESAEGIETVGDLTRLRAAVA